LNKLQPADTQFTPETAKSCAGMLRIPRQHAGILFAQSNGGVAQRISMEFFLDFDKDLTSHTLEHRGCGIRAASYEVRPKSWLPEACVWLQTKAGHSKLWVHSFAHCFGAEDLTFPNKFAADTWALDAAKSIIDRAFAELFLAGLDDSSHRTRRLFAFFGVAHYRVFCLRALRYFRSRH
jgi:hypothetical protein